MMYFRPDPTVLDSRFLLHSIYGPVVKRYIEHASAGSTVSHLRLGQVYALPLLWCPVEEQRAIADHIDAATAVIDRTIAGALSEISLLNEFRARLIADVVTGKLDVREAAARLPDEVEELETAEELEEFAELDEDMEGEELEAAVAEAGA
jgi:type I restriction enzyme S subunit